jgi:glycine oxidase
MARNAEVLILGGGVIGLTTAYFLAREGVQVEVVDQGDFGQEASWAGAGILPPGNPAHARTPFDQLRAHSSALFPIISAELRERTAIDNGYLRCGGLELPGGDRSETTAQEWRGEGIAVESLDEAAARRLEPALAPGFESAIHLPELAQVRNPRHLKALLAACAGYGVSLRPGCAVHGFEIDGARVRAAQTALGKLSASRFLIAAGAWSDRLLEQVGWRPGIHPVRGQIALLNAGTPLFRRVLMWRSQYLVPRPDGRVLVGSTEEDVGFVKSTTAGAIRELLALACWLVPGLADAQVERTWAGLRPGSPDGLPFLGPVPGCDNLYVAAGHYRAGLQTSTGTGLVMKELLLGQPLTIPLGPFRLDRANTATTVATSR